VYWFKLLNRDVANTLYERIASVIRGARESIVRSVDTTMVKAYWHIGQHIIEEEQGGAKRAAYGKELLIRLPNMTENPTQCVGRRK